MSVRTCRNGDITIAYETFGDASGQPLLLIAPLMEQSRLLFHEDFCAALAGRGFHVARFDHRDAGLSTHLDASKKSHPYSLADMATDAVAVLDELDWPSAHIAGASLGGMIGQIMAVHHAGRVRTLTSLSSAPCWRWRVSRTRFRTLAKLATLNQGSKPGPDAAGDHLVTMFRVVGSPAYPVDEPWLRRIARQCPPDPAAVRRQLAAARASGDRRAELSRVTAPTLVVHGEADPMQSLRAAHETVRAIPGARLVTYPGMGHDLPRELWPAIISEIAALADIHLGCQSG